MLDSVLSPPFVNRYRRFASCDNKVCSVPTGASFAVYGTSPGGNNHSIFGSNAPFKTCLSATESCSCSTFSFLGLSFALFTFVAISCIIGGTALPDSDSADMPRLLVSAGWDCVVVPCSSMTEPSGFLLIIMLFSLTVLLKSKFVYDFN